jgi:hypothetical protein
VRTTATAHAMSRTFFCKVFSGPCTAKDLENSNSNKTASSNRNDTKFIYNP